MNDNVNLNAAKSPNDPSSPTAGTKAESPLDAETAVRCSAWLGSEISEKSFLSDGDKVIWWMDSHKYSLPVKVMHQQMFGMIHTLKERGYLSESLNFFSSSKPFEGEISTIWNSRRSSVSPSIATVREDTRKQSDSIKTKNESASDFGTKNDDVSGLNETERMSLGSCFMGDGMVEPNDSSSPTAATMRVERKEDAWNS